MSPRRFPALTFALVALVGCGGGGDGEAAPVTRPTLPASTTPSSASTSTTSSGPTITADPRPAAPWSAVPLSARDTPAVLLDEWTQSGSKSDCPPLAFSALGDGTGGVPRAAEYGDSGWAVAWDKPGAPGQLPDGRSSPTAGRSTFGIAGVGGLSGAFTAWPYSVEWADGSSAGYGVEGGGAEVDGTTTKWLAYLRLAGHDCLYNVWSNLGRTHLEYLLGQLRAVDGHPI